LFIGFFFRMSISPVFGGVGWMARFFYLIFIFGCWMGNEFFFLLWPLDGEHDFLLLFQDVQEVDWYVS
jgi:hypothetical protein